MIKKIKIAFIIVLSSAVAYILYSYVPYRFEFAGHYDKIWAHRNNSIEKANITENYFKGLELDLVYHKNEDFLDVNHPPATSIHLSFDNYVAALKKQPFLWLDIKNLKENNASLILNKLQQIIQKHKYPLSKILVETRYPNALVHFTKYGFKTSYYLPFLYKLDSVNVKKELLNIQKTLDLQQNIGISFYYRDYELIRNLYPNKTKYTWITDGVRQRNFKLAKKILNDTTVKVVLIRFKTFKGHR